MYPQVRRPAGREPELFRPREPELAHLTHQCSTHLSRRNQQYREPQPPEPYPVVRWRRLVPPRPRRTGRAQPGCLRQYPPGPPDCPREPSGPMEPNQPNPLNRTEKPNLPPKPSPPEQPN